MPTHSQWIHLKLAAFVLMLLTSAGGAVAQTAEDAIRFSQRSPAAGPRMMGFAGAGIAGTADYGAVYRNPAGLGFAQTSSFSGAMQFLRVKDQAFSSSGGFTSSRQGHQVNDTQIGSLGYTYKVPTRRGALVLAAGFNQVHSFSRVLGFAGTNSESTISSSFLPYDDEYTLNGTDLETLADLPFMAFNGGVVEFFPEFLEDDPNAYPFLEAVKPGTPIDQFGRVAESGRMNELSLGGAVEVVSGVMAGFGLNIVYGRYDFESTFEEEDTFDTNKADDYSVVQDDGTLLSGFHSLTYRQSLNSDLLGINVRLGISGAVGKNLRLGAVLETPTVYAIEENYSTQLETVFDHGGALSYGARDDDVGNGFYDYDLTAPWRFGTGIGYQANRLQVLADVEWIDWSRMRFDAASDRAFFGELNQTISEDFRGVLNTRVGAEVTLGRFAVRLGLAMQPDPYRGPVSNSSGAALNLDRLFYSGGLGVRLNRKLNVDLGWIVGNYDTLYLAYPEDSLGPRQTGVLHIDEQVKDTQIVLGANFRF